MNHRLVSRIIGSLLTLLAFAMLGCALFARFDVVAGDEIAFVAMLKATGITGAAGLLLVALSGFEKHKGRIPRRDAVIIVGLSWLLCGVFGGLPYMLCPPHMNFAEAFFETASGFTTTGSTVMADIEAWPRGILLWRSVSQWLGGIGILVLFVAVLSYLGMGSKSLFQNESSYRGGEAGLARIHDTSLLLLRIYFGITLISTLGLHAMGLTWYNAVSHSMTAVSTGGFSPHNLSVAFYSQWGNGWLIELWLTVIMFLCSLNFLLFVVILRKNWKRLGQEEDAKQLFAICLFCILLIASGRAVSGELGFVPALRDASFVVVSISSTTGFGTADYELWPTWSKMILAVLMVIGGCAGSTAGGVKVGRLMVFLKIARHEIIHSFRPTRVFRLAINGNVLDAGARLRTVFFVAMYLGIALVASMIVGMLEAGTSIDMETCFGSVIAALSSIGPGFGTVGPTENFGHLREATQIFLGLIMILGRLELFALLVLLFPSAWRRY